MAKQQEDLPAMDGMEVGQWQNGTVAGANNHTRSFLSLDRFKNWSGIPALGSFPSTISPGKSARFTHLRSGQFGSIAAVQYSGLNADGVNCAWILAWQAPVENAPPCPPNRVYVECGLKSSMDAITWEDIIMKLDNSPTENYATDDTTKTAANACIHDLTRDVATISANFSLIQGRHKKIGGPVPKIKVRPLLPKKPWPMVGTEVSEL